MKVLTALLFCFFFSVPCWAVLGQSEQSVTSDQRRLRGALRSVNQQGYTVHEIDGADGRVVKEYVAPNGMVFGVSWRGPTMPDLQNLLGSYFAEFQRSAGNAPTPRRRALAVQTDDVVVQSAGHMRDFHGRAYVPSLLPGNVGQEVVQ